MIAMAAYVNYVPISLWFGPSSDNFTFENFFNEFVVRWQGGSYASILFLIAADLLTYAPFYYLYVLWSGAGSWNFTSNQWYQFSAYSAVAYVFQLVITVIVGGIAVSTLSE